MATILTLCARTELFEITVPLNKGEFPERFIYGFPEFIQWMAKDVSQLNAGRLQAAQSPAEQLDDILYRWTAGRRMRYGRWFQDLMPRSDEVWEMKSADLRIFGWIHRPRYFIAVFGDYADFYKGRNPTKSYESARRTVISSRLRLDLDEPKFATGTFDDLVSV